MHSKLLYVLKPNNKHLKYNLHFYIMLVAAINNKDQSEIRKELSKLLGYTTAAQITRYATVSSNGRLPIKHENMILICDYINSNIPGLELTSDDLLTSGNEKAIRVFDTMLSIEPKSLGLTKP